jgi:hypothetical protein
LSACDTGTSNGAGNRATPVRPVDILKKVPGCKITPGISDRDVDGNPYATCRIPVGDAKSTATDDVTVYVYADHADVERETMTREGSTGSTKVITGDTFILRYTGTVDPDVGGTVFSIDPATLARDVGGTLR